MKETDNNHYYSPLESSVCLDVNGVHKKNSQQPLQLVFTPEQMLAKGREGLSDARRPEAIKAEVRLKSEGEGSIDDLREYIKSYVIHKQTAMYLIGPAKLIEGLRLTQLDVEDKARGTISRRVLENGGTMEQASQIAEDKILLTKRFQILRRVTDPEPAS